MFEVCLRELREAVVLAVAAQITPPMCIDASGAWQQPQQ